MNAGRLFEVGRHELAFTVRRPMLWVLIAVLGLMVWGLSAGGVTISSGDSQVGGTEAHITSQFSQALTLSVTILILYGFFLAVAAGMAVIHDDEHKLGEILHATLLTPAEYVWGKFLAVMTAFAGVMTVHLSLAAFFNHVLADAASAEYIGPFSAANYVVPALAFGVPVIVFLGGVAFATGTITRRPILVFLFPVVVMFGTLSFLISWSPDWLSPSINRLLMMVDPSGYRWLNETWLKVDRGVEFYNSGSIGFDSGFVLSRIGFMLTGLAAVVLSQHHFARSLSGVAEPGRLARLGQSLVRRIRRGDAAALVATDAPARAPLAELGMKTVPVGFFKTIGTIAQAEVRELLTRPGLYLFVPLIMIQATGNIVTTVAAFDAPALLTPGAMAGQMLNTLNLLVCFLLLFYMVESLQREYSTGFAPIFYATPARTGAILMGKALGTSLVGVVILGAMMTLCLLILLWQQLANGSPVALSMWPFLITWGAVLVPTFVVWCAFVLAVFGLTRSRYTTYAVGIVALVYTVYRQVFGDGLTWLTNWLGWSAVRWSDMGLFPLNGRPLLWNRLFVLSLAVLLVTLAVRWYGRRDHDPQRIFQRLQPTSLLWSAVRLLPALIVPLALGISLWLNVESGYQSETEERAQKDYWRRNFATWRDSRQPAPEHVDLDVELEPARRWMRVEGTYRLQNQHDVRLDSWAMTPGRTEDLTWTLAGKGFEADDRAGLHVFEHALEPGETVELGFSYERFFPKGYNRTGGGAGEFILDAAVVLTSFGPQWVPMIGYLEQVGIDEDNSFDPRDYPDDFYEGITPNGFGLQGRPYTTRIRVTGPEEFQFNSVGVLTESSVSEGRRTVVWESDHPVTFFNLVGGRWDVREGEGTAVYYHPEHTYNIDEIGEALDAARRYYSEWFYPYPWQLLKLSEFPALAGYAQGFPTNITFSESIGFLTRSDPRARAAFMVTAHEAAHQWWGNILTPGRGPGGNLLSEGMSHYATLMLTEQQLGEGQRIETSKRFESRYANRRQVDSERPMVKIDGSRPGDSVVTYEKMGWVAWMLMELMGRDPMLAGLQEFITTFSPSPDYPVLQDLVATLRPHAPDGAAFDAFVDQWFFEVVMPEYRLADAAVQAQGDGWRVTATIENIGTGTMPLELAAIRGVRFPDLIEGSPADTDADVETYREARTVITLAAGESIAIEILADFEPETLIVDPDAIVLQLRREFASADLTTS